MRHFERVDDPTLAEIAERCLEVQAQWNETQRRSRAVGPVAGWLPPLWPDVEDRNEPERGWN